MSDAPVVKRMVTLYEPHAEETAADEAIAPRASNLQGCVVGLLDNTKDFADQLLREVGALLQQDFPRLELRVFRKKNVSGATPDLIDKLATCNAVVTAIGD